MYREMLKLQLQKHQVYHIPTNEISVRLFNFKFPTTSLRQQYRRNAFTGGLDLLFPGSSQRRSYSLTPAKILPFCVKKQEAEKPLEDRMEDVS